MKIVACGLMHLQLDLEQIAELFIHHAALKNQDIIDNHLVFFWHNEGEYKDHVARQPEVRAALERLDPYWLQGEWPD